MKNTELKLNKLLLIDNPTNNEEIIVRTIAPIADFEVSSDISFGTHLSFSRTVMSEQLVQIPLFSFSLNASHSVQL